MTGKNKMRFGSFCWPKMPETLQITHGRRYAEQKPAYHTGILQDLGEETVTVSGEGVFRGGGAEAYFSALKALCSGEAGLLKMPGLPPFMARLVKLERIGQITPQKVGYRFLFLKDHEASMPEKTETAAGVCLALANDTLWRIANQHHTTADVLLEKNPHIQWPGCLPEGTQVMLP